MVTGTIFSFTMSGLVLFFIFYFFFLGGGGDFGVVFNLRSFNTF